jgi:hypothetical protein
LGRPNRSPAARKEPQPVPRKTLIRTSSPATASAARRSTLSRSTSRARVRHSLPPSTSASKEKHTSVRQVRTEADRPPGAAVYALRPTASGSPQSAWSPGRLSSARAVYLVLPRPDTADTRPHVPAQQALAVPADSHDTRAAFSERSSTDKSATRDRQTKTATLVAWPRGSLGAVVTIRCRAARQVWTGPAWPGSKARAGVAWCCCWGAWRRSRRRRAHRRGRCR